MAPHRWYRLPLLAGCVVMVGACLATVAPPPPPPADLANPGAVTAAVHLMEGVFGTPAIQSLATFGPLMSIAAGPPTAPTAASPKACGAVHPSPASAGWPPALGTAGAIPDSLFRHVFVYDSASGSYLLTGDLTGPPDGVRFLLDAVDSTGRPTAPPDAHRWSAPHG